MLMIIFTQMTEDAPVSSAFALKVFITRMFLV